MGLEGTIKRRDGRPLGSIAEVQTALSSVFSGVTLHRSLSGIEKLQIATEQGITFPEILREHLASSPSKYEGAYESAEFSVEFYMDDSEVIQEIGVVLRGTTSRSKTFFALLGERFGWIITHP
jgi:hypothetical protein